MILNSFFLEKKTEAKIIYTVVDCRSFRVYHKFRRNLSAQNEMIIFGSFLTNFEVSNIFWGTSGSNDNWLKPKIK